MCGAGFGGKPPSGPPTNAKRPSSPSASRISFEKRAGLFDAIASGMPASASRRVTASAPGRSVDDVGPIFS